MADRWRRTASGRTRPPEVHDLGGKVCVVTGATRGIGRPTAEALARAGAAVVVHGRDPAAVDATCRDIARATGNKAVSGVVGRFDSLADVRRIAADVLARHDRLDVLVNNAGTTARRRQLTEDGHEWQFAVNHLAPFLLTGLLLERLCASAPARIVTVASGAHRRGRLDFDDLDWTRRRYRLLQAYADSKLANVLFTRELADRLAATGVTANCLHPGVVATHIFRSLGLPGRLFEWVARPWLLSPEAGARTTLHVAGSADVTGVSGEYFDGSAIAAASPAGRDAATASRLWDLSAARVGLPPGRPAHG